MIGYNNLEDYWPERLGKEEEEKLFQFLHERFGIPLEVLMEFLWFKRGGHIYGLKGIRAMEIREDFFRPHRWFLGALGRFITKARIWLNLDQLKGLKDSPLEFSLDISAGPVVLAVKDIGDVGMGFYKNGQLRAQGLWI